MLILFYSLVSLIFIFLISLIIKALIIGISAKKEAKKSKLVKNNKTD